MAVVPPKLDLSLFYDTMDLLGVSKSEAKRCAAKIHKIAVSYVDKIMTTKWQQEKSGVG
jgi:hypothetical protein